MGILKLTEASLGKLENSAGTQSYYWDADLSGFGVVVGKRTKTFIARAYVQGKKRKIKIGTAGKVREDGRSWTVTLARQRAKTLLGEMSAGMDPNGDKRARKAGPTLREGLDVHVERMRKKRCSERTILTMQKEVPKYLGEWLDRPIVDITGTVMIALHDQIKRNVKARRGSNPENPKGAPLANRVIAHISAIWNTLNKRLHGKLGWNPAQSVDRDRLRPKRERIPEEELPNWLLRVNALSPIRRDLQHFVMFTGMRSEASRHVRWEHIDWERGALLVPRPKGGESRSFTLPIPSALLERLKQRQRDNMSLFSKWGGDQGWVFPSLSQRAPIHVIPLVEPREVRGTKKAQKRQTQLPGLHTLRRTYESVAHEAGITELDLHVLTNHSFSSHNVNATYIAQAFKHLASCQEKISKALQFRMGM